MSWKITDILRGMYVRVPPPVRKSVAPFLSLLPSSLKYGETYKTFRDAIGRSEEDPEFVVQYQNDRMRELLKKCYGRSKHYTKVMDQLGINPEQPRLSWREVVSCFPVLRGNYLREHMRDLLTEPQDALDEISTSGSSGRPLVFYLDKDRSVKEWAFIHHIWSRTGYRASDKRAVLRGVHISNVDKQPWEYDSALREFRLSPFHLTSDNINRFLCEIESRRIEYLHGYPSALGLVAKYVLKNSWTWSTNIKGILPISEPLYIYQRRQIQMAFPSAKILPFYGLSEKTAIACEVDEDVYEFEPLYGITELLDEEGAPVTEQGCRGRIVSTGLLHLGMPLVRYDTEDEAELVQEAREDNAFRLRVRNIHPRRSQEFVLGMSGELISIAAINIHSAAYSHIREFQFYQEKPGQVEVRLVPEENASYENLQAFVDEIQSKVGSSILFTLKEVSSVGKNSRGKSKFIVQKLDLSMYPNH